MKNAYHSFNKGDSIFYEQWDLFEVSWLKKTKKESREEFCKTWSHSYHDPAKSTPNNYSKAYDTVKDFMTRIKLLDNNAKFYWYCSASFGNDSNNIWGKIYALYNREVIPEQRDEQWNVTREALIEPTTYRLEDFPYDQWKFMTLALFDEILWSFNLNESEHWVCKETCDLCTAENLEMKKINVEPQWKRNLPSWNDDGNE